MRIRPALVALALALAHQAHAKDRTYKVRRGDNLPRVSQKFYGTTKYWKAIAEWNGVEAPYGLRAGQKLVLRESPAEGTSDTPAQAGGDAPASSDASAPQSPPAPKRLAARAAKGTASAPATQGTAPAPAAPERAAAEEELPRPTSGLPQGLDAAPGGSTEAAKAAAPEAPEAVAAALVKAAEAPVKPAPAPSAPESARPWPPDSMVLAEEMETTANEATDAVAPALPTERAPQAVSAATVETPRWPRMPHSLATGVVAGVDYLFPAAHFQYAIKPKLTVGAMGFFLTTISSSTRVSGPGLFATATWWLTDEAFSGLHARVGTGFYALNGSGDNASALALFASLGARAPLLSSVDAGVSMGLQYVAHPALNAAVPFGGYLPWFAADVGYRF